MRMLMVAITVAGFICSFGGFKQLISFMYPILGYMGMLLLAVLLIGWLKEHQNIIFEKFARRKMLRISIKKQHPEMKVTKKDRELYDELSEISPADTADLKTDISKMAKKIVANVDDSKAFVKKELPVDDDKLHESLDKKK